MALRMKEVIGMVLRKRLRELVEAEEILILPGAYDALSAKLVQAAGFRAVYLTGYGQSASKLGEPDVGLMCMSEMAERTRDIAMAVDIPVACDADTGFGNPVNVIRTVREYERAGAAAIQLEDQTMPKKCGHMLGRQVVPAEEMAEKIRAAAAARGDPDFLIIARTDARTEHGIDEAIRRGRLYEEAGADIIMLDNMTDDEMRAAVKYIAGRALVEISGNVTAENVSRLKNIGANVVSCGALTHSAPILDVSLKNLHPVDVSEFFDEE